MNSILHAMETSMSASEIEDLIRNLSESEIPQPISYLLSQAQKKFGELRVIQKDQVSIVEGDDPIVLMQILNEAALSGLLLRESPTGLSSRLSQDLIYFNLRDKGYPAVMVDVEGEVISPRMRHFEPAIAEIPVALEIAKSLLTAEAKSPGIDDHLRQLEFALKNKLQVGIRVQMPEEIAEFEMTPLGISGGRFRGRDVVKEAERTLPLSRILAVWLS